MQPNPHFTRQTLWLAPPTLLVTALTLILLLPGSASTRALPHADSRPAAARRINLTVTSAHPGKEFALGAIGLSIETEELTTQALSADQKSLVALMRLLGPGVLRIGGNSLDSSSWTSDDKQPPAWATSVVTPAALFNLRDLLAATDWRVILGVDLGHFDPASAAHEAHVAESILGSRLLGFEIGNEPNGYGIPLVNLRSDSYSADDYLKEVAIYSTAMRAAAPGVRLYGPDLGTNPSKAWLSAITSDKSPPFTAITQHYYPTTYSVSKGVCKGTPVPTALDLLSSRVREQENATLQTIVGTADLAHRETRISETNDTSSCDKAGGPATSPVFASALWSLDWALRATSAGVAGLNFHGYIGRCLPEGFGPICALDHAATTAGRVIARPEYYGLLAARQLEGGRFIPVEISGENASDDLTAYATEHSRGVITLAVDNFATKGKTSFILHVPGYDKAAGEPLTAPSVSATSNVTFGHRSIDAAGLLKPTGTTISKIDGAFRLELAPSSALVVTLHR